MAARLNRLCKEQFKYYVYVFYSGDKCVYVGKGCGGRFATQKRRFKEFTGNIHAYFINEKLALDHERFMIGELQPSHNVLLNNKPNPWKTQLSPESNELEFWINSIGSRNVAARILLAKPWSILKSFGVDIERLLSKVDNYDGQYYGKNC